MYNGSQALCISTVSVEIELHFNEMVLKLVWSQCTILRACFASVTIIIIPPRIMPKALFRTHETDSSDHHFQGRSAVVFPIGEYVKACLRIRLSSILSKCWYHWHVCWEFFSFKLKDSCSFPFILRCIRQPSIEIHFR